MFVLRDCYKKLSPELRGSYWVLVTNVFVVIFTFWLGIFVQDLVASKSSSASLKLARYEIVDKMYDSYTYLYDSCSNVIGDMGKITLMDIPKKEKEMKIKKYIYNNKYEILDFAKKTVDIVGRNKFYFDKNKSKEADLNNGYILMGIRLFQLVNGTVSYEYKEIVDNIMDYMSSAKFMLLANPNENISALAESGFSLYKLAKYQKDDLNFQLIKEFVLIPAIKNVNLMDNELNYAKYEDKSIWSNFSEIYKNKTIYVLVISLIFGLIICELFVRKIAPNIQHDQKISNLIKQIDYYKLELDNRMIDISGKNKIIDSKNKEIERLKNEKK